jgi:hypothetical protein
MACRAGPRRGTSEPSICVSYSIGAGVGRRAELVIVRNFREIGGFLLVDSSVRLRSLM